MSSSEQHDAKIEQMVKAEGADKAPRVSKETIDNLMKRVVFHKIMKPDDRPILFVHAYLDDSFYLGYGFSKAVNLANFNEVVGLEVATRQAEEAARNKLWELEGYLLYALMQVYKPVGCPALD